MMAPPPARPTALPRDSLKDSRLAPRRRRMTRGVIDPDDLALVFERFGSLSEGLMALPDFVIVKVMGGGDLDAARAEFGVNVMIGDHRNDATRQGQGHAGTNEVLIARVIGMDRNSGIPQHSFWPSRSHF